MLQRAAHELEADLASSWMIGDKMADVEAGRAAGCQTILVKTGYGSVEAVSAHKNQAVFDDFRAAASHIIELTSQG